jgi:hypothetical protein
MHINIAEGRVGMLWVLFLLKLNVRFVCGDYTCVNLRTLVIVELTDDKKIEKFRYLPK